MTQDKNSTAGDISSDVPVVVGVAEPTTDVEAQTRPEPQRVEELAGDIAGKKMGIVLFSLILAGIITAFLLPFLSLALIIAAIVIASILTCGCCCAKDYNLKPHVKKWATATLVTLSLTFVVQVIGVVIAAAVVGTTYETEEDMINSMYTSAVIIGSVVIILDVLALVFSGLFTWGRNCGAPSSLG
ncbi:hypothetical protein ACHAW5_007789 [Stephanodiscus triporus]|uniref:Transmembrane protein n=1 Tax=Stephanodiscus triporus TaxID=2934178 RepID=A0ABD3MIC0_9STRA